jgi:hypothetical protein
MRSKSHVNILLKSARGKNTDPLTLLNNYPSSKVMGNDWEEKSNNRIIKHKAKVCTLPMRKEKRERIERKLKEK